MAFVRRNEAQHVPQSLHEPLLARDRSRIARLSEVLVVQHQKHVVVHLREARELVIAVVHGRRLGHELPHRRESSSQIGHEGRYRLGELLRLFFEVDRHAVRIRRMKRCR